MLMETRQSLSDYVTLSQILLLGPLSNLHISVSDNTKESRVVTRPVGLLNTDVKVIPPSVIDR